MRIKKALFPVIAAAILCGCAGYRTFEEKEELRRAEARMQSVREMIGSKQLPPVEFETDSAELLKSSYPALDKIADIVLSDRNLRITIEGHCDDTGSDEYNMRLSQARASAVKSYLVKKGVYPDLVNAQGYGKTRPVTDDTSEKGRALNRRVEFRLSTRKWSAVY